MRQAQHELNVATGGPGLYEITGEVEGWVRTQAMEAGLLTLFCRHTSASLTIQENADPDVQRDLQTFFERLVKEDPSLYRHTAEGLADIVCREHRIGVTVRTLGIDVNQTHLYRSKAFA